MIKELIQSAQDEFVQENQSEEQLDVMKTYYVEGMKKAFMIMFEQYLYGDIKFDIVDG